MDLKTTSEQITFSFIIANYNSEKFIEEAIRSIINQTYDCWELIIVDDYSDDNSVAKIKSFLHDKRIRLICLNKNRGVGFASKIAINNARNDVIVVLDNDDKLHKNALNILKKAYDRYHKCGFIYTKMWICDENLEHCKVYNWIKPIYPPKTAIFFTPVAHLRSFRKSAYVKTSGYDIYEHETNDKDIIYKLEEVTDFKYIDVPLYYYRTHEKGLTQGKKQLISKIHCFMAKRKAHERRIKMEKNIPCYKLRYLFLYLKAILYLFKSKSKSINHSKGFNIFIRNIRLKIIDISLEIFIFIYGIIFNLIYKFKKLSKKNKG